MNALFYVSVLIGGMLFGAGLTLATMLLSNSSGGNGYEEAFICG